MAFKNKKNRLFKEVEDFAQKKIDIIFTSNKKLDKLSKKSPRCCSINRTDPIL